MQHLGTSMKEMEMFHNSREQNGFHSTISGNVLIVFQNPTALDLGAMGRFVYYYSLYGFAVAGFT